MRSALYSEYGVRAMWNSPFPEIVMRSTKAGGAALTRTATAERPRREQFYPLKTKLRQHPSFSLDADFDVNKQLREYFCSRVSTEEAKTFTPDRRTMLTIYGHEVNVYLLRQNWRENRTQTARLPSLFVSQLPQKAIEE